MGLLDDALAIVEEAKRSVGVKSAEAAPASIEQDLRPLSAFKASIADIPDRGAMDVFTAGLKRGVQVVIPRAEGQAMQFFSEPGRTMYEKGKGIVEAAAGYEKTPELRPITETETQKHPVASFFSAGAEQVPLSMAGMVPILGDAIFYGSQAQESYETVKKQLLAQGVPEADAESQAVSAGHKSGAIEAGGERIASLFGAKMLGIFGKAAGVGQKTAAGVLKRIAKPEFLKSFAKDIATTTVAEVATEVSQNVGERAVEQAAGATDGRTLFEAGKEAIAPTIAMTFLMAPFGIPLRYQAATKHKEMLKALDDPQKSLEERASAAEVVASAIEKTNTQAAENFRANSAFAIDLGMPIKLDDSFLAPAKTRMRSMEGAKGFVLQGEGKQESFESTLDRIKQATETGGKAAVFNFPSIIPGQNAPTIAPQAGIQAQQPSDIGFSRASDLVEEGAPLEGEVLPVDRGELPGHVPEELQGQAFPSALLPQGAEVPAVRPTGIPAVMPTGPRQVVQNELPGAPVRPALAPGGIGEVPAVRQAAGLPAISDIATPQERLAQKAKADAVLKSVIEETPPPAPVQKAAPPTPKPEPIVSGKQAPVPIPPFDNTRAKGLVESAGMVYNGTMDNAEGVPQLILFTDKETQGTYSLPIDDVSEESIAKKIAEKRVDFAKYEEKSAYEKAISEHSWGSSKETSDAISNSIKEKIEPVVALQKMIREKYGDTIILRRRSKKEIIRDGIKSFSVPGGNADILGTGTQIAIEVPVSAIVAHYEFQPELFKGSKGENEVLVNMKNGAPSSLVSKETGENKPATKPENVNVFKSSKADLVKELADAGITENKLTGKMTKNMGKADLTQMVKKLREGKHAETVRSDERQVRRGSKKGKQEVQSGAVEGGGNLQQQAPAATGGAVDRGRAVPEVKPQILGDIDLNKIPVNIKVKVAEVVAETGKSNKVSMNAREALKDNTADISRYEALLRCMNA